MVTNNRCLSLLFLAFAVAFGSASAADIGAVSAAVESVSSTTSVRASIIVSVTDNQGKPVEAFVNAYDHIGPPPPQPIGTPRAGFEIYAWLCESFPQVGKSACGWVPFKIDGEIKVLKSVDPSIALLQSSVYQFDAVPSANTTIGNDDFSKPGRHIRFLIRARISQAIPSGANGKLNFQILSQREAVAIWPTPAK